MIFLIFSWVHSLINDIHSQTSGSAVVDFQIHPSVQSYRRVLLRQSMECAIMSYKDINQVSTNFSFYYVVISSENWKASYKYHDIRRFIDAFMECWKKTLAKDKHFGYEMYTWQIHAHGASYTEREVISSCDILYICVCVVCVCVCVCVFVCVYIYIYSETSL